MSPSPSAFRPETGYAILETLSHGSVYASGGGETGEDGP